MEIYKLSDEIPVDRLTKKHKYDRMSLEASEDVGVSGGGILKITAMKQGVKNPNRVNVFVNEKYAFSLDVAQVVDLKLKVGTEMSAEDLAEYKKKSEFGKLYQRALEWVLVRPRSVKELSDYLCRKLKTSSSDSLPRARRYGAQSLNPLLVSRGRSSEDIIELSRNIIDLLMSKGYVDDRKFAEYYVENRFVKKGISQKRLKMELMKKGVAKEIIDEVVCARDDEEEILKIIAKKRKKYDDEKLIQYLCRQGFSYQLAQSLVAVHEKD